MANTQNDIIYMKNDITNIKKILGQLSLVVDNIQKQIKVTVEGSESCNVQGNLATKTNLECYEFVNCFVLILLNA